jgi:hypothetical protein
MTCKTVLHHHLYLEKKEFCVTMHLGDTMLEDPEGNVPVICISLILFFIAISFLVISII